MDYFILGFSGHIGLHVDRYGSVVGGMRDEIVTMTSNAPCNARELGGTGHAGIF